MNPSASRNRIMELYLLLAADLFSVVVSYTVAVMIRFEGLSSLGRGQLHYTACLYLLLLSTLYSLLLDWNRGFLKRGYLVEMIVVLKYNIIMIIGITFVFFLTRQIDTYSRAILGMFFAFNMILTWGIHVICKRLLRRYLKSHYCRVSMLVVTEENLLEETITSLKASMPMNYEIAAIALMDEKYDETRKAYQDIPIKADRDSVLEVAKQLPLDEVFLKIPHIPSKKLRELIRAFESMGVICHYSLDIADWNAKESTIGKLGGYTVISYAIHQLDYRRLMIKRMMDIVGGMVGLIITAILTPLIALAIRIESKGPVLFSQIRIGKNGRRFRIYKFRSMYLDAEKRKQELLSQNEMNGLMFKIKDDPRITKVGKFLRKTSLDELPQFFNILIGDMSLVGTRPPTADEFENYSLYYRRRLCMTPGLTGLWQVSGRSEVEDFDDVVKYDLEYIDNWSLSLDFKILIQTIWVVFVGRGSS